MTLNYNLQDQTHFPGLFQVLAILGKNSRTFQDFPERIGNL